MQNNRDYGYKDQLQRASVSIMNNIAEGFESGSDPLFIRYLNIAKGSCGEVRSMLILGKELGYFIDEELQLKVIHISKGIKKLIERIKNKK